MIREGQAARIKEQVKHFRFTFLRFPTAPATTMVGRARPPACSIMLKRRKTLQQPRTPPMGENRRTNAAFSRRSQGLAEYAEVFKSPQYLETLSFQVPDDFL